MSVEEIKFERRVIETIVAWYNVKLIPHMLADAIEGFVERQVKQQLEKELSDLELPETTLWDMELELDRFIVDGTIGVRVSLAREIER